MKQKFFQSKTVLTLSCLSCLASSASGAGFSTRVQSAQSLGTGYAAEGTGKDTSLIFSNPALIGSFDGHEITVGLSNIMPNVDFKDGTRTIPSVGTDANDPNSGVEGVTNSSTTIPTISAVHPVTEKINIGWSVTAPFGTSSDYGEEWVGRYHASETKLTVLNLDIAGSYKLNDQWTFGAGVQIQKGSGILAGASNGSAALVQAGAAEFGEALAQFGTNPDIYNNLTGTAASIKAAYEGLVAGGASQGAETATLAAGSVLTAIDGQNDIIANYEGESLAYGLVFGATYDHSPELRVGLSYRSSVKHETDGDVVLEGDTATANALIQALGLTAGASTGANLDITLPDSVLLASSYQATPELMLYANATLMRWSTVDQLNVVYKNIDRNILVKLDWKDTVSLSFGGDYALNENVNLRFGLASDPSPTSDDLRSPRSPDNNRTVISLGGGYAQDQWRVDAALAHYIMDEPTLNLKENAYTEANGRGDLNGSYDTSINTFMLQFGYQI